MPLIQLVVSFAIPFVIVLAMTPLVRNMAARWKISEKPNGRSNGDIAHLGGVVIVISVIVGLVPVFLFFVVSHSVTTVFLSVLILSGFTIFLLGIIDDLRSLHYKYKLILQIIASIFVSVGGIILLSYFSVFEFSTLIRVILFVIVTLWILAITTSFNLIDGIDGLAGGIAVVSSIAFTVAGLILGQQIAVFLSVIILGSSLAFLCYNFPPARIFMGDSGSLFLGLIFGLISLLFLLPGKDILFRIAGSIFILTVPLLDTTLAFSRRIIKKRSLFQADLKHLHHLLLARYKSMRKVNFILWSLAVLLGCLGVFTMMGNVAAFIAAVILEIAIFAFSLYAMNSRKVPEESIESIMKKHRSTI